eukprot:NODE_2531_length_908_cov_80.093132_g2078_i0.p2 GENE.NODE_2531_length_908_cov_80.093132_g2078_i0~~NODE_2531_length_908_cov_80.093132_g2078_i0.p2  ORF type:complete len:162 (-),score=22.15 NODE_2531_length_908_cov_80.093132_g2078_i0:239-724(-)
MTSKNIPHIKQFLVAGRALPSRDEACPKIFQMTVFAPNYVVAKQRFWRVMRMQNKIKRTNGQTLKVEYIPDKDTLTVKNYSILARFICRTGVMNVTKEFRDTTLAGAVSKMYLVPYLSCALGGEQEMSGRHHIKYNNIDIVGTTVLKPNQIRSEAVKQFVV